MELGWMVPGRCLIPLSNISNRALRRPMSHVNPSKGRVASFEVIPWIKRWGPVDKWPFCTRLQLLGRFNVSKWQSRWLLVSDMAFQYKCAVQSVYRLIHLRHTVYIWQKNLIRQSDRLPKNLGNVFFILSRYQKMKSLKNLTPPVTSITSSYTDN